MLLCSGRENYGGGRGGYDNYAPNSQANGQQQSFGSRGSGGFDNYSSRGGQGGGQAGGCNYLRGREINVVDCWHL